MLKLLFSARNVGNIVPHARHFDPTNPSPEAAVLELGKLAMFSFRKVFNFVHI